MGKEKLGLALGGGGGKGAYQIGVWKYLAEIGLDSYVSVVFFYEYLRGWI